MNPHDQWGTLDSGGRGSELIGYLVQQAELRRDISQIAYGMMSLQSDESVLDVGCGPATELFEFEKLVGDGGRVVGIDSSEAMVSEGQLRASSLGSRR